MKYFDHKKLFFVDLSAKIWYSIYSSKLKAVYGNQNDYGQECKKPTISILIKGILPVELSHFEAIINMKFFK